MLPFTTPVDHALPFIAVVVIAIAVLCGRRAAAVLFAIPLLVACAICFPDPHARLLGYGIVVAAAFCGAFWAIEEWTFVRCAGLTLAGIALLRWIARERVEVWREIVIVLGAFVIVSVMRKGPLAVTVALAAAFLTPGIPTRTLLIPFAVAAVVATGTPLIRNKTPHFVSAPAFVTAVMLILFPWSGVAARGIAYFFRAAPAQRIAPLNFALKPGESIDVDVPGDAKSVAISAANAVRLKGDSVAGTLDGRKLTMRDLADWGYMRREQWWRSRNRLPRVPAGIIRGYGYDAWVDGAGRIPLPPHATRIRIAADPHLPADARLQVEAFER
ncbi:MAG TPA: hypothetical protein VGR95_02120 [Thermoanaerobaculia bacterium]|nr:hypothetical protein [Thermoanaerobaculia bacterium]